MHIVSVIECILSEHFIRILSSHIFCDFTLWLFCDDTRKNYRQKHIATVQNRIKKILITMKMRFTHLAATIKRLVTWLPSPVT